MNRQREMIAAIVKKAATPDDGDQSVHLVESEHRGRRSRSSAGETTDLTHLIGLVSPMLTISKGDGYTMMVPIADANRRTSAGSSVIWDNAKAKDMFGQLARGDTSNLERFIP